MLKSLCTGGFTCILLFCGYLATAQTQNYKIADGTLNAGKVEWQRNINVGEIPYDVPVIREFEVKNVSNEPLLLVNVKAGCHCTIIEYPHDPIPPGETTHIKAIYDAKKEGDFYKVISVTTNFDPNQAVVLALTGKVLPQ